MALSVVPTGSLPFVPGMSTPQSAQGTLASRAALDLVELSPEARVRRLDQRGDSITQIAFKTGLDPITVKIDLSF